MNGKKRHKCLILMLSLKLSKQTRSEASKNKVIIKRVSNTAEKSRNSMGDGKGGRGVGS